MPRRLRLSVPLKRKPLSARGVGTVQLPHCSLNLNAHSERFIQTLRVECLDKFIMLETRHLDHLVGEFVQHYNMERPHSGVGHRAPVGPAPPKTTGQ